MRQGRAPSAPGDWALAAVPAAMLCVLLLRPVWDVDIFWQLKLGELILDRGGPVLHEPFAAPHLGEPLPAVAWAGQALFATARGFGGWTGLRLFDALCWCGGFWALAAACRARGAGAARVALALVLGFLAALPAASIRPQSFAALCFGGLLALLKLELRPALTVALAVPLLVLWQNLHPSVSIAAIALGARALVGWIAAIRCGEPRPWAETWLVPAALASMFATPDGFDVLAVSARNAQASISVGASEWLPLWTPGNFTNAVPVVVIAALALFLGRRRGWGPAAWPDLAVMLVLLVMTVTAYRFVLFWAVAVVPIIAWPSRDPQGVPRASLWPMAAALLLVGVATPLLRPTRFSENLPLAAVESLASTGVEGTIFTEPEFGGVLIDAGYPRWQVSYDGRYYRYTPEEWGRFGEVLGGKVRLREIERRYRPAAFLLRPSHSTPLCDELDRNPRRWRRIYQDEGAAVWIPAAAR